MSMKFLSLRIVILTMAFGILVLPMGVPSYAGAEPKADAAPHDDRLLADFKFINVLEGRISAEDSFAKVVTHGYRLGTNDVLNIRVYNEAQLSGQYRVDAMGKILMPLIGGVDVIAKTAAELSGEIEAKLKEGYLRSPSVSVEIASFRPYYLIGEVRTPGHFSYAYGLDVIKAVAMAGGYTYRANQKKVYIKRDFNGMKEVIEAHADTLIYPGDVITVKERFF
jgi:protein involved in polysaccharide export with SLBB domain